MRRLAFALTAIACFGAVKALATEMRARDTAEVSGPKSGSVGIFNPLKVGISENIELESHPLLHLALTPNAKARWVHWRGVGKLTGEYGISAPTRLMRLGGGYLFPSWKQSDQQIGWTAVPSAGLTYSIGEGGTWTARADFAKGIHLSRSDAKPTDTWAPLEILLAPALNRYRARIGTGYDFPLLDWFRVRTEINAYRTGDVSKSPYYFSGYLGMDFGLGPHSRLTLGMMAWNSDQRATKVVQDETGRNVRERVRSNDFLPVLDVIWNW